MACGSDGQDVPGAAERFSLGRGVRPYLAIITEHHRQRSVLRLRGELDVSNAGRVRRAVSSALEHRPAPLVVDLSGLSFIDCAGLAVLVWAHQRLAGHGLELVITGEGPAVRRLLRLTGLDTHLRLGPPAALEDNPDESAYA